MMVRGCAPSVRRSYLLGVRRSAKRCSRCGSKLLPVVAMFSAAAAGYCALYAPHASEMCSACSTADAHVEMSCAKMCNGVGNVGADVGVTFGRAHVASNA